MNEVNFSLMRQSSSSRTILNTPTTRPAACLYLGCLHQIYPSYSHREHCSQYTLRVITAVMLEVNLYLEISCLLACFTFLGIYHKLSMCVCVCLILCSVSKIIPKVLVSMQISFDFRNILSIRPGFVSLLRRSEFPSVTGYVIF